MALLGEPATLFLHVNASRWHRWVTCLLLALGWSASASAAESFSGPYLSEFMADNRHGVKDEDGDQPGWIEIHNGGSELINLAGWFLTDSATSLGKWRFPAVSLLPNQSLLVFASGKGRTRDPAHLHASFRLDPGGGYLALVDRATNIVSSFGPAYPRQSADVSYGRVRGEPATCGFFTRPTPWKPNASSGPGFAPEVFFSRSGGGFTAPFALELACRASNAVVRYTIDGRMPGRTSPGYRGPLWITNTTPVRARAFQDGLLPGPLQGETYLLLDPGVANFSSTLPILIMDTLGSEGPAAPGSHYARMQFSAFQPTNGHTRLTNAPQLATRGGYHARGSSSSGMPQPSFAIQFLDQLNQEQHRPLLGLPAESDWVLYAPNGYEPVMIHNPFVHQLSRDLGRYSPRTRFVEVFFARHPGALTPDDYHGIYVLEEKIKIGRNRVDIDRLGPTDVQAPEVTGGYLLKIDRLGPGEGGFSAGGVSLVYVEPKELIMTQPQRAAQRQYLERFLNDFDRALSGPQWKDPVLGYPAYLEVDAWIDFHLLEVLSGNVDSLVLSSYFHKPRQGKLIFGPHWDFDRALGSTDGRDDNPRQWNTGRFFDAPWWSTLFSDPDFWQRWVDRWQELRGSHFSMPNLDRLIDQLAGELREAQPRQVKRWGLQPRGGSYQGEIDLMKAWLSNRTEFIDRQLVRPPRFGRPGGPVAAGFPLTLSGPANATIYYTLDGTDPRLAQGVVASNAVAYAGPIRIERRARIVARSRDPRQQQPGGPPSTSPWSRAISETFEITLGKPAE